MTSRRSSRDRAEGSAKLVGGRPGGTSRRQAARNPEAVLQAAVDAINGGDYETGLKLAEQVLRVGGHRVAAEVAAHAALHLDTDAAISALTRLNKVQRNDPALLNDLGGVLCQAKRFEDAETRFRQSLKLRPRHSATLANLGQALLGQKKHEGAAAVFAEAVEIDPSSPSGHSGLGAALEGLDRFEDAVAAHCQALALEPDNRIYQDNLEHAYLQAGTGQAERERMYRACLQVDSDDVATTMALGGVVYDQRRFDEAKAIFERVLELGPSEKQEARSRLALNEIAFIQGDYETAWKNYVWRLKTGDVEVRHHPFAQWQGEDLRGKTILIWEEQGLGECLMFLQFVPIMLARGARIVYETKPRFAPVVADAFPEFEIMLVQDPPASVGRSDIDFQSSVGDLGQWLWPAFSTRQPQPLPRFASKMSEAFRTRYLHETCAEPGTKLVGLAWRSVVSRLGPTKSLRLGDLGEILARPRTVFVDLQYGDTRKEIAKAEQAFGCTIYHDETFDQRLDLVSFFAQVGALDAVMSISNTTLHVAGSIGVPTAGLLSTVPMWRWEFDRDKVIWYPSVRLFRQAAPGDWSAPVREALAFVNSAISGPATLKI